MPSFIRRIISFGLVQLVIETIVLLALAKGIVELLRFLPAVLYNNVTSNVVSGLTILVVFVLLGRWLERRNAAEIGLPWHHAVGMLLIGLLLGGALMGAIIGIMALAGWYHIIGMAPLEQLPGLILTSLLLFFGAALSEEILYRGVIYRHTERVLGSWIALLLSAVIFGVSHLSNPHATLGGAVAIILTGGLLTGAVYMLTRNIWLLIGFHWAWNFFQGPIFGTQVSGRSTNVVLHSVTSGPILWTGGTFGPEAGLVTVLLCGSIAVGLLLLALRRGCLITPSWMQRRSSQEILAPEPTMTV